MIRSFFGFILLLLFSCNSEKQKEDVFLKKHEPHLQMNFQRAFPDESIDLKEMDKAYQSVTQHADFTKSNLDHPWQLEGPKNIGGRINCIAVHPNNQDIIWVGNSSGGVFATVNGGETWNPIADELGYLSIGAIEFNPINPLEVYVGTGDPNIGGLPHPGNGIYKTTDGGLSWTHLGLTDERIISSIEINYNNPDTVYAGAMGTPFVRDENRGLYRSTDAGETWEQVLFVSDEAGIIDMEMNFENPNILYASSWVRIRNNQESTIYGEDAHIYKSIDGGDTWDLIEFGIPEGEKGRIGLAMSGQDPDKIFCVIVSTISQLEGIYKSNDGGEVWNAIATWEIPENALGGFGWYFGQIRVNPFDDEEISLLGVDMYTTENSGASWFQSVPVWWLYEVHADKHDMVYLDAETTLLATDGGLYKSSNNMGLWTDIDDIPNTQFYRIALDPNNPDFYTGGAQDNGTTTGNIDSINVWNRDFGGDGFQAIYPPDMPDIKYASTQRGNFYYYDASFEEWNGFNDGIDEFDRTNWDSPLLLSNHNDEVMYTGTYRMYINDLSPYGFWYPISEDLTDGDVFGSTFHTISTVAESMVNPDFLYAGTTDGNVWSYSSETGLWDNVTFGLPERYVTNIKTSWEDEDVVYVCHSGYKDNEQTAHIHKSENRGSTWIDITGDLPEQPVNHLEIINDSVHIAATDMGVYFTENSGLNWSRIGNNMPSIPVYDIEVDTVNDRLIAGTFARSIWSFPMDSLLTNVVIPDSTVYIEQPISGGNFLNIVENPVANQLRFVTNMEFDKWTIYSINGTIVLEDRSPNHSNGIVEVSSLNKGVYVLSLQSASGVFLNRKFLIQR